jgi:hypothetical protein
VPGAGALTSPARTSTASLILDDLAWENILPGFAVVAALGALMLALTVRTIQRYD